MNWWLALNNDICHIQTSNNSFIFKIACELFFKKWSDLRKNNSKFNNFLEYFKTEWVDSKENNWYEGAHGNCQPSTNNSLEATNNSIKSTHTFRKREDLGDFLDKFKNLTQTWSFDRFEGEDQLKKFQTDPLITSNQWNAYDNYINNAKSKCKLVGNFGVILVVRTKTDADEELDFIYNEKINSMIDLIECEKENCFCLIENSNFDSFVRLNKSQSIELFLTTRIGNLVRVVVPFI